MDIFVKYLINVNENVACYTIRFKNGILNIGPDLKKSCINLIWPVYFESARLLNFVFKKYLKLPQVQILSSSVAIKGYLSYLRSVLRLSKKQKLANMLKTTLSVKGLRTLTNLTIFLDIYPLVRARVYFQRGF